MGRPIAGAQVRASQQGLGDLGVVVGTDPSGRFRFERLSAARYRVEAQHAQYASVALEVVLPLATEVLLAFSEQAALEVSVTGPAGEAVAGATVTARRPSQGTLLASGPLTRVGA